MQLASSGARALVKGYKASSMPGRSIHIPAYVPRPTTKPTSSTVQGIFKRTRTLLTSFVSHLTTPGTFGRSVNVSGVGRSLYPPQTHARTFHQGLSFPARYTLGRTLHSPSLPRAHPVPRSITQVGLGTARNFSTGRPVFQSLADNVPIVGRALWEADIEVKTMEKRARFLPKKQVKARKPSRKEMYRPRPVQQSLAAEKETEEAIQKTELDHYFPATPEPEVTTYLLIPLAPTPTNRLPLRDSPHLHSSTHPLLPFSVIASLHSDHATHSLRVSTIFARLDESRVFDDVGVSCSAYGDPSGQCTVLEVKFDGWSEHRVRSVLGEAGMGWCVLEEVCKEDEMKEKADMEELLSNMDSDENFTRPSSPGAIDPSTSFVLPTLDFSASFPAQSNVWSPPGVPSTPLSDLAFHNDWTSSVNQSESDALSDSDSDMEMGSISSWSDNMTPVSSPPLSRSTSFGSETGWMGVGFSSQFASQVARSDVDWAEPRDDFF
ncbi:hypothetical protein BXZ70DRAFT_938494 [Cristinia sonorae]|uniref:Uncharacterized protein n=1 Tax=Cristinia sonorae TaxID=1940300 RepID=A0A8K0UNM1_9AGAR|nr:hypothetical protein BXZ70DRAFT_938494 [Cristinia sonorae]